MHIVSRVHLFKNHIESYPFKKSSLEFLDTNLVNKFSCLRGHNLSETILKKKYNQLATEVIDSYSTYLNQSLPDFLAALKQSGDPFYKKFLNPYGDNRFCKFKMADSAMSDCKGLYLYTIHNRIMYVGITTDSCYKRINAGYGNISPKNCYLDGQATNCHLNSLINDTDHTNLSLWICALDDISRIEAVEQHFIEQLKPLWNIALKPVHQSNCLYFTNCSEAKNPDFKNSMDATTPDNLYDSDRIKKFFGYVSERDVPWAVFSDKYGFVFPSSLITWYDKSPDAVSKEEIDLFVDEAIDKLLNYEKIIYCTGDMPIHPTYQKLFDSMRFHGVKVEIERECHSNL